MKTFKLTFNKIKIFEKLFSLKYKKLKFSKIFIKIHFYDFILLYFSITKKKNNYKSNIPASYTHDVSI